MPQITSLRSSPQTVLEIKYKDHTKTISAKTVDAWSKTHPSATVEQFVLMLREAIKSNVVDVYIHVYSKKQRNYGVLVVNPGAKVVLEGDGAWWRD